MALNDERRNTKGCLYGRVGNANLGSKKALKDMRAFLDTTRTVSQLYRDITPASISVDSAS